MKPLSLSLSTLVLAMAAATPFESKDGNTTTEVTEVEDRGLPQHNSTGLAALAKKACFFRAFSGSHCGTDHGVGGKIKLDCDHFGSVSHCIHCNDQHSFKITGKCEEFDHPDIRLHGKDNCPAWGGFADAKFKKGLCYNVVLKNCHGNAANWQSSKVETKRSGGESQLERAEIECQFLLVPA